MGTEHFRNILTALVVVILPLQFSFSSPSDPRDHCQRNVTAQAGLTARLFCCLGLRNSDLGISWVRQRDLVILSHGTTVFTTDTRVKVVHHFKTGLWELRLGLVGAEDAGRYQCQANSEPKQSWPVNLHVKDTRAEIVGGPELYLKAGSQLRLLCRVDLGHSGPDQHFRENGVLHWFQDQRLIDPGPTRHQRPADPGLSRVQPPRDQRRIDPGPSSHGSDRGNKTLDTGGGRGDSSRIHTSTSLTNVYKGWLTIERTVPADSGNYSCVPSYTTPAWVIVHIIKDESGPAELHDGNGQPATSSCSRTAMAAWTRCEVFHVLSLYVGWRTLFQ